MNACCPTLIGLFNYVGNHQAATRLIFFFHKLEKTYSKVDFYYVAEELYFVVVMDFCKKNQTVEIELILPPSCDP